MFGGKKNSKITDSTVFLTHGLSFTAASCQVNVMTLKSQNNTFRPNIRNI